MSNCKTENKRYMENKNQCSATSIINSSAYKKMKSNLERKLQLAEKQIQNLKKQLQNAVKQQRVIMEHSNQKERLLKLNFDKKRKDFQQNLKKRVKLMENRWQKQLSTKIHHLKLVAFKQGVQEGERCIREISKKFENSITLPNHAKCSHPAKNHAQRKKCSKENNKNQCTQVA